MKWAPDIADKKIKLAFASNQPNLLVKIVVAFCLSTAVVWAIVSIVLYRAVLDDSAHSLSQIARSSARLVTTIAEHDLKNNLQGSVADLQVATIPAIKEAFSKPLRIGNTGEILIVHDRGGAVEILVHQFIHNTENEHEEIVSYDSEYGRLMLRALAGETGRNQLTDNHGHAILVAYEPIPGTPLALIVERQLSDLLQPFRYAAIVAALIAVLIIVPATIFTYRSAVLVSLRAREAETKSEQLLLEARASQALLDKALSSMSEGFAYFDADDRLVVCNQKFRTIYSSQENPIQSGATFEEILRGGLVVGAFPDAYGREDEWLQIRLAQHAEARTVEQQLYDGRWLNISEERLPDGGIVGIRTDITDLKNREQQLRASEQRFRDFVDTASDWFWETDADHRFILLDTGNMYIPDYDPSFCEGKRRIEFADEDVDNVKWRTHMACLNAHRPFQDFRYWMKYPETPRMYVSISGKPIYDDAGNFLGFRGTGRDMTSENAAYEKLNQAELLLRSALQNVTVGVVVADQKGIITAFNKEASRIFGYSPDEAIGRNVSMLAAGKDRTNHDNYIRNFLDTGETKIIGRGREVVAVRKNGETFPVSLGIAQMMIEGKSSFIASTIDLSDQKIMEQKLRQSQKMEAVGQLVGGIAHDFNNILGIIIGNLDLIRIVTDADSLPSQQAEKALSAATRGAVLTRRLLNFSRQEPMEIAPVDVNETLRDLHELLQKSLTELVEVELVLDEDAPLAMAEQGDLEGAITNLCINARDAIPDGGKITIETGTFTIDDFVEVDLRELLPGRYTAIKVTDNGIGMPAKIRDHIFEPFFSTKEKNKGTGLGLSMVYGFAKRCGGLVTVDSEPGKGSTFSIYLPVAEDGQFPALKVHSGEYNLSELNGSETVLIVDDEEDLLKIAAATLRDLGYTVLTANCGAQAMELLNANPAIDLMITDVIMPGGVDGYHLARTVRKLYPRIRVCMASGYTGSEAVPEGSLKSTFQMIRKPYLNNQLAQFVRSNLDADAEAVSS